MKDNQKLIYKTTEYSKFVQDDKNRDFQSHPELKKSMQAFGFINDYPIVVVPDGSRFKIKDGGHRFHYAKELQLPIFYKISTHDEIDPADVSRAMKRWTVSDFIGHYIKEGSSSYQRLLDFSQQHDLPVGISAKLLAKNGGGSTSGLIQGKFNVDREKQASAVLMVINGIRDRVKWATQARFISALDMVFRYSKAVPSTMLAKLRQHSGMLTPQPSTDLIISNLDKIYNYRNQEQVSIELQVKEAVRTQKLKNCKKALEARLSK